MGQVMSIEADEKIFKAYKIIRPQAGNTWMFAGTSLQELFKTLKDELENFEGDPEDNDILIQQFEISQEEIDNMQEFPGW